MAGLGSALEPLNGDVVIQLRAHAERVAPAHFVLRFKIAALGFGFECGDVDGFLVRIHQTFSGTSKGLRAGRLSRALAPSSVKRSLAGSNSSDLPT